MIYIVLCMKIVLFDMMVAGQGAVDPSTGVWISLGCGLVKVNLAFRFQAKK